MNTLTVLWLMMALLPFLFLGAISLGATKTKLSLTGICWDFNYYYRPLQCETLINLVVKPQLSYYQELRKARKTELSSLLCPESCVSPLTLIKKLRTVSTKAILRNYNLISYDYVRFEELLGQLFYLLIYILVFFFAGVTL